MRTTRLWVCWAFRGHYRSDMVPLTCQSLAARAPNKRPPGAAQAALARAAPLQRRHGCGAAEHELNGRGSVVARLTQSKYNLDRNNHKSRTTNPDAQYT